MIHPYMMQEVRETMQRCNVTTCRSVNFWLTGLNTAVPPINTYTPVFDPKDNEYCWEPKVCKPGK